MVDFEYKILWLIDQNHSYIIVQSPPPFDQIFGLLKNCMKKAVYFEICVSNIAGIVYDCSLLTGCKLSVHVLEKTRNGKTQTQTGDCLCLY